MVKSLELFGQAENKTIDVLTLVRTNPLFAPLRARPEIKKFLKDK